MLINRIEANPSILLVALTEITVAAGAWEIFVRRRRITALRILAGQWAMHFAVEDRFGLGEQVATHAPVPGAAKVRARDLIYQWNGNDFFCAFTLGYTQGVVSNKHRRETVAGMRQIGNQFSWAVAEGNGKLVERYEEVRRKLAVNV